MNRAERRKQKKLAHREAKKGSNNFGNEGKALMQLISEQKTEEATRQARELTRQYPKNVYAHFWFGTVLWKTGDNDAAIKAFKRAAKLKPTHIPTQGNLGNVYYSDGKLSHAADCFRKVLKLNPNDGQAHFNLANTLKGQCELSLALKHYEKALVSAPKDISYHNGKGLALRALGQYQDAIDCFDRALEIKSQSLNSIANRGSTFRLLGDLEEAIRCYERARVISPRNSRVLYNLANLEIENKQVAKAIAAFETLIEIDDGNLSEKEREASKHLLAALQGETTSTAPQAYVQALFDEYAEDFECHVQSTLNYSVPKDLYEMWSNLIPSEVKCARALDLGCGTGLVGVEFSSRVESMVGVDLSHKMLEQARHKDVYDELIEAEILDFLKSSAGNYDLVIAADVFIYLGALEAVMPAIGTRLSEKACLAFSIEEMTESGFSLRSSGRYAHHSDYVEQLLGESGLSVLQKEASVIRVENGAEILGLLYVAQKT